MVRNYREEIEIALAGGAPEYVPFSFYDLLYPKGFDPSPLQAKGMAVCARRDVYRKVMPNVKVTEVREQDGGVRTIYTTPIGALTAVMRSAGMKVWPRPPGIGFKMSVCGFTRVVRHHITSSME